MKVDTDNSLSYEEKYDKELLHDYPGSFIFLIDQSGSMEGEAIEICKDALKLFIKSLPDNSEFDIIGFGGSYYSYFDAPLCYNKKNVKLALSEISSIRAQLGATNISNPLKHVFLDSNKYNPTLNKTVFILTDGIVSDPNICYSLVNKYSSLFSVNVIGIGSQISKAFISKLSKLGNGVPGFAPDLQDIKSVVISSLNSALKPYITDISIKLPNKTKSLVEYPKMNSSSIVHQDSKFIFGFISNSKLKDDASIVIRYKNQSSQITEEKSIDIKKAIVNIADGETLARTLVGLRLKNSGEENIDLSLKYNVICSDTVLLAYIQNENKIIGESKLYNLDLSKASKENDKYKSFALSSKMYEECNKIKICRSTGFTGKSSALLGKKSRKDEDEAIHKQKSYLEKFYDQIILSQNIKGYWNKSGLSIPNVLLEKYKGKYDEILASVRKNSNSYDLKLLSEDDIITTMLILFLLKNEFQGLFNEHKLIINKAEKVLPKARVNLLN